MGGLSGYKTSDGTLIRTKGGGTKEQFMNSASLQRTRENASEFGGAAKAAKVLRNALRTLIANASDSKMVSRLTQQFVAVIKTDEINDRGQRNILDAETEMLQGFEFNAKAKFSTTVFSKVTSIINRATGVNGVTFNGMTPSRDIAAPTGTTHIKFMAAATAVDFEQETGESISEESDFLAYTNTAIEDTDLSLTANSTHPIFVAVGIEFYQQVNGKYYPLNNGAFNALQIAKVEGI